MNVIFDITNLNSFINFIIETVLSSNNNIQFSHLSEFFKIPNFAINPLRKEPGVLKVLQLYLDYLKNG